MDKVLMVSLGCPKNLVDSEIITGVLMNSQFEMTVKEENADIVIINTCSFIQPAVEEAIEHILYYSELKKEGKIKKLIVAGCLVERYKEEILDDLEEIDMCVGIKGIKDIDKLIRNGEMSCIYGGDYDIDFLNLPRSISSDSPYAYVKIADGCDNKCTYCTIPSIRGKMQSRSIEDIVSEIKLLEHNHIREIILVAQDVTAYGLDRYKKLALADLIKTIIKETEAVWIRLLYCYPESMTDELIDLMAAEKRFLNYIDIPLQHASDRILRLMNRKGTYEEYVSLIQKLREKVPDVVVRTTFITGFPGEEKEDIDILARFIKEIQFERIGIFAYCLEEGTPAFKLPGRVNEKEKNKRKEFLMSIQQEISFSKNKSRLNSIYDVLIENVSEDGIFYEGRSYGEAPEIDITIYVTSPEPLEKGDIIKVRILNVEQYDLIGEALHEFTE
ncbi:MAG: 30S ribosomal protein S12 methylthiotransferase RimO [Clostridia bacterium]|nr:30S ribosomal protein S12 methylthiotransferase RimO [Clostridia bacterium]